MMMEYVTLAVCAVGVVESVVETVTVTVCADAGVPEIVTVLPSVETVAVRPSAGSPVTVVA